MKNTTKLEKVKKLLDENGVKWHEPKKKGKRGHSDLVLPDFRIYIKVSGDDDQVFFDIRKLDGTKVNNGSISYKKLKLINTQKTILTERRNSGSIPPRS